LKERDDGIPIKYNYGMEVGLELYDLHNDISETQNVKDEHPELVEQLLILADSCKVELGDALTGVEGRANREPGMQVFAIEENMVLAII
jgi:hypothetical protein